jgi:hypothetical protein
MKKLATFILLLSLLMLSGCVTTAYHKSVVVKKDANGKITETIETEEITQPWREDFPFPYQRIEAPFTNSPNSTPAKKSDPAW